MNKSELESLLGKIKRIQGMMTHVAVGGYHPEQKIAEKDNEYQDLYKSIKDDFASLKTQNIELPDRNGFTSLLEFQGYWKSENLNWQGRRDCINNLYAGTEQLISSILEGSSLIKSPDLKTTSAIVERAISDIEILLQNNGAVSGVDRIHTALHGYLRAVCDREKIIYGKDDSMAKLFKLLRQSHPALQLGERSQDIERVLQSFATILDALNPIRNNASVAHPSNNLLEKDEATLVINAARTLLHYLDAKFS